MKDGCVTSDLFGITSYKYLEKIDEDVLTTIQEGYNTPGDNQIQYILLQSVKRERTSMVIAPKNYSTSRWKRLLGVVENSQRTMLANPYYTWPIDCVVDKRLKGMIVRQIDTSVYRNIDQYFVKPECDRWHLGISLLKAVQCLHRRGFAMNGFLRSQVWVGVESEEVLIFPGFFLTPVDASEPEEWREDYFLFPRKIRDDKSRWEFMSARQKDLFSAVTMCFYLLYYTHPFIGSAFWSKTRAEYYTQYSYYPMFIFDAKVDNQPGSEEFDGIIRAQWDRSVPQLKNLFMNFFLDICYGDRMFAGQKHWNIEAWIEALARDSEVNNNEVSRPKFPFNVVASYRV